MRLEPGSRLGPYEIAGPIGAGGMGEVYRARDTRLGREVAIKVLPHELSRDAQRLARFEREARSSSALNHPNIVTIHDFSSQDGETWLVMELVRGESLRDLVSRGALPMKKILAIAAGIADGLAAAHAAGIVHRDLKPENVMVTRDGTAKILDFGLVKQTAIEDVTNSPTDVQVSRSGTILGTAGYMSPEQARADDVDFRTDQFSLGLILHEMATGKHPFRRPTAVETLTAILNDAPPPLSDEFPTPFIWIVERCLAKDPAERYGSTSDLAYELRRLGSASTIHSFSTGQVKPARKKSALTWPGMVASAALIVVAAGVAVWMRRPQKIGEPIQTTVATPDIAQVSREEITVPIALSPDGRFLVVYGMDAGGIPGLWLTELRSGASRQIARNTFSAGWSDDSKAICYFADGKLKTIGVDGGPPRTVCDARPESTPSWRGDTILYTQYSLERPGIYRVNAAGGKPELLVPPERVRNGFPFAPQFLPDGKQFLYLMILQPVDIPDIDHELRIGSLDGAPYKKVPSSIDSRATYANGNLLYVRDGTLLAQPFDIERVRFTGEAKPLVNDLHYFRSTGNAAFSVSDTGILSWAAAHPKARLALVDRSGVELKSIDRAPFRGDGRLSPDGHRYAAAVVDPKQGVSDVWVYDLDRDSSDRATSTNLDERAPVWAADGRTLFYRSDGGGGPPDIFRLRPGEERGSPFFQGPSVEEPQDASRDGKWLLYMDYRQSAESDIKLLSLTNPPVSRPFVATPFNERSPRFSPDGRWVAYQSDLSGRPEVYVRAFDASAVSTRISQEGGTRPRWRGDDKELFYVAPEGRVMGVPMRDGSPAGAPRMLFQLPDVISLEPAADGSRFLVEVEEHRADPPVHLLVNWRARLR